MEVSPVFIADNVSYDGTIQDSDSNNFLSAKDRHESEKTMPHPTPLMKQNIWIR